MATVGLEWHALRDCRVLVVDDHELVRALIGSILNSAGLTEIAFAADGGDALARVDAFMPDLIVLDIMMPRVDGFAVLERLRARDAWMDVPVLMLTAADDHQVRNRAFMAGATDFVSKPINRLEFLARVKVHLSAWELLRRQAEQLKRIDSELREAQHMQVALLPSKETLDELESSHGLVVRHHFESSMRVGGDYWTIRVLDEDSVGFLICDFSGHGVTAAMNTVRLHTLLHDVSEEVWRDPPRLLRLLNRHLIELLSLGQFATLLYGIVDRRTDRLTFASAATPDPFIGEVGARTAARLDGSGLPLGLSNDAAHPPRVAPFPAGSYLFLYSDALYENRPPVPGESARARFFEDFHTILERSGGERLLPDLLKWFYDHAPPPPRDDLTAVWIERRF